MREVIVIAHRGGFLPEGPIPLVQDKYVIPENTLKSFKRAFGNRWGVETDVRIWEDGNFALIHDADTKRFSTYPQFKVPALDELCQLANGLFIAFQIKRGHYPEDGVKVGKTVAEKMQQYNLKNSILFDATLEEAAILRAEFPWLNLSVSVGEENYSPTIYTPRQVLTKRFKNTYNCIWADEWKINGSIYNKDMFKRLKDAYPGRIDVISPELHYNEKHPLSRNLEAIKALWDEIIKWGTASGICTDYPTTLQLLLSSHKN